MMSKTTIQVVHDLELATHSAKSNYGWPLAFVASPFGTSVWKSCQRIGPNLARALLLRSPYLFARYTVNSSSPGMPFAYTSSSSTSDGLRAAGQASTPGRCRPASCTAPTSTGGVRSVATRAPGHG